LRLLRAGDGLVCVTKEFSMAMQRGRALAHTTRLVSGMALVAMFSLWSPGRADGPADNLPDNVRPIPPVGIELDDSVQQRLLGGAESLVRDVEAVAAADAADRAEVLVFARAVRLAVEDRFLYSPQEVALAEQLLERGRQRLRLLAAGTRGATLLEAAAPSPAQPGQPLLAVGGFVSRIDGSIQPYGLVLPAGFDPADRTPRRLDVWLHGRGEKMSEVAFLAQRQKNVGEIAPPDTIVLHPYGRYSNAFKFAGEVDVLEAIAHVRSLLPVDDRRITIRGFSMGGAGCWQLAVHHPGAWMAATPGAGFSETSDFLRVFQQEEFHATEAQRRLLHWYDCPDWANNLRTLPTVAYSGELDVQKQAADMMVAACKARGFEMPHVIGPQTAHKIHPESRAEIEAFLARQAEQGRPDVPREIDFTTYTLRYPSRAWLTVTGLGEHWQKARVQAVIQSPAAIEVSTRNVTGLAIDIPAAASIVDAGRPVELRVDGTVITVPPRAGPRWRLALGRAPSGWRLDDDAAAAGLRKRPGLQGPIDDAFMEAFLFVGPEPSREPTSAVDRWVAEEFMRAKREWRRHFRGDVVERRAADVTPEEIATRNLVLFGTLTSNPLVARVLPQLPVVERDGHWVIGSGRAAVGESVPVLVFPNPLASDRYVVLNSGFTFRDYAYLNNARQIPMLPDWALVSVTGGRGSQLPGTILAEGFFDERWQPTAAATWVHAAK
jgi:pimeloyl-ACP methyl ester carboxylesterase